MAAAVAKKGGEEGTLESDKNQAMRMFIRLGSAGLTGFQVCGWLSSLCFVCLDLEAGARACIHRGSNLFDKRFFPVKYWIVIAYAVSCCLLPKQTPYNL